MATIPPVVWVRADQYDAITGLPLADTAVAGVVPPPSGPIPSLARPTYPVDRPGLDPYPELVSRWVQDQLQAQLRARERRDRNMAMLLWGVHL